MSKLIDLTGKKFGNLKVLSLSKKRDRSNKLIWLCKCKCGKKYSVRGHDLRADKTKSCGCLQHRIGSENPHWQGTGEIPGQYLGVLKSNAKSRSLPFTITSQKLWTLFIQQNKKCALSGINLKFKSRASVSDGTASLDRIDSSKGYIEGNIQWVHKDVNRMKWEIPNHLFIKYCKTIYNFNVNQIS